MRHSQRIALLAALLLSLAFCFPLYSASVQLKFIRMFPCDFSHFYTTALVLKSGLPSLYDDDKLLAFAQQAGIGPITGGARTAPAAIALLVPLTAFDLFTATKIFIVVNHILLGASLFLAYRSYRILRPEQEAQPGLAVLLSLGILASTPMLENLIQGQLNVICLFSSSLSYYLWLQGRSTWAGFWLWPAISAKLFPAALALYYLLKRDYKAATTAAVATIAMNAVAGAIFGWHFAAQYPARLLAIVGGSFPKDFGNQSLRNAIGHWLQIVIGEDPPVLFTNILWSICAAAAVLGLIWFVRRKAASQNLVAELTLLSLTQYFISSYSTSAQHIGLYLPLMMVALDLCNERERLYKVRWVLLVSWFIIATGDGYAARNLFYAYYQSISCNLYLPVVCHLAIWLAVFYSHLRMDEAEAAEEATAQPS